jgi:C4-dicarboxylate-specific signal transduction histidine kinase
LISLQSQLANDVPFIFGDRIQLQQVTPNPILNAIEAMIGQPIASAKDDWNGVLVRV